MPQRHRSTQNKKKLRRQARAACATRASCAASCAAACAAGDRGRAVRFAMMAKPAGPACNLRCRYCFYLEKEAFFQGGDNHRMSEEVLEAFVRKYIASQPPGPVQFSWQGGEPTLMGLDFYRRAVEIQKRCAGGRTIGNTLQTNGTLLDESWARFLADGDWLVGLSLDGPSACHDRYRLDARGQGSFEAVMRGLEALQRHGVRYNVMASVTPANVHRPIEVYEFFKSSGVEYVQFMPVVERMPDEPAGKMGLKLAVGVRCGQRQPAVHLTPWSVEAEAYGEFLCRLFDHWRTRDVGRFTVMNFEWAMAWRLGEPTRVCQFMPVCGRSPIIEHNGDVYACDHYVYPEYRLGNVLRDELGPMMQSARQCAFGRAKLDALPPYCLQCPIGPACWGECPKRRFLDSPDGVGKVNHLCPAYRRFFTHAGGYLEAVARRIRDRKTVPVRRAPSAQT